MKLSRESEYGLKGLMYLAQKPPGTILLLTEIAAAEGLPQSFLAKIFQKFCHCGLLRSHRGATRGYTLAKPAGEIRILEIIQAIEGPGLLDRCVFWSTRCAEDAPCLLHPYWREIKPRLVEMMEQTSLQDVAQRPKALAGDPRHD